MNSHASIWVMTLVTFLPTRLAGTGTSFTVRVKAEPMGPLMRTVGRTSMNALMGLAPSTTVLCTSVCMRLLPVRSPVSRSSRTGLTLPLSS